MRGALLLIDYGLARHEYYHVQRGRGTLRCHFRHRAHDDPLLHPGLQDITAWVDFTRVAEAGTDAGLTIAGYCTQAAFLLANGIESDVRVRRRCDGAGPAWPRRPGSCCCQARWGSTSRSWH